MMEVASFAIDKLINVASEAASMMNGTVREGEENALPGSEIAEVTLDDGRIAKIRMS